jgi:GTP-binding protein
MRANALRAGLEDYDLNEEDRDILETATEDPDAIVYLPALPVLAIVGRPNVGKSALVNRILGRREAVVQDTPGVTRDRVTYKAEWGDRRFTLVDTGGWEPDAKGINASVAAQAEIAVDLADAVLFIVDANVGATSTDEHVVRMLRATKKPVILVANKVDDARQEPEAATLWSLGLGQPWPVSALHGRGVADLLDHILTILPEVSTVAKEEVGGPRRVAILGRPNVGKSSLLNKAVGEERVVVNELAGTTRDPVDEQVELGGKVWRFIDTAGIRRRMNLAQGADFYASLRTSAALEKAEVAVVVLDVSDVISEQDVRIIDLVLESGRALVLAFNKWDLMDDDRRTGPRPCGLGSSSQHLGQDRTPPREARAGARACAQVVGHPHPDRQVQRARRRARVGASPPRARRQAAAHSIRHPGGHPAADVRAVHDRIPGPRLSQVHHASPAGDFRFRGKPDQREHARARAAQAHLAT